MGQTVTIKTKIRKRQKKIKKGEKKCPTCGGSGKVKG